MKYIDSPDAIRNEEVSKYKKEWMSHALDLVPDELVQAFPDSLRQLFQEVFLNYSTAMKTAILEYILRSPEERKRLHILLLPRPNPSSLVKQSLQGGYSTAKYSGHHNIKL